MSFVVPFDGSDLSAAALVNARNAQVGVTHLPPDIRRESFQQRQPTVTAVAVVPQSASYAREKGWIADGESFSPRKVVERLHEHVTTLAPNAQFEYAQTTTTAAGAIGLKLRNKARKLDATTVFIGSKNAGRIVSPIMSVGSRVSAERDYNVFIVRNELPPTVTPRPKSDFYAS